MLEAHEASLKAFDASPEALNVLITPSAVLKAHNIDLTFKWLPKWSPAYHRTMRDPGPLDPNGKPTNPRYQPGAGSGALRSYGVPHPSAGMPVGDLLRRHRAASRAGNPTQRAEHGPPAVRCPAGVPFPMPAGKGPRKRPLSGPEKWQKWKKQFADVDYSRPYTTKRR